MALKRQLYLWHRWLGIGLCLLMALWFVSGVVMLYVGYPKLTSSERLGHLPALPATCCAEVPEQWAQLPLQRLRLSSLGGQPFYLLELADGRRVTLDALSGEPLARADEAWVLAGARQYAGDVPLRYRGQFEEDVWTHSRALDTERPLHLVELGDAERTWLYLSGKTGEVVRDASLQERRWNWLGAWLHWLYPLRSGFGFDNGWRVLVIGLSLLGTAMAALGMVVGLMRWRFRKPYRNGSRSPYSGGWLRWHHIGGLLFGVVLVAWIFSGLMSMRPWGATDSRSRLDAALMQGGELRAADISLSVSSALQLLRTELDVVELEWRRLDGSTYLVARAARAACCTARPCCVSCPANNCSIRPTLWRQLRHCKASGWSASIPTTSPAMRKACTARRTDRCRCCGCASMTLSRPGSTSTRPAARWSRGMTSASGSAAGCSTCCTAGTGRRYWSARCCAKP